MDNIRQLGELAGLSRTEQTAIKLMLIEHERNTNLVKTQFEQDFGRRITAGAIKSVLSKFDSDITAAIEIQRQSPSGQRLFHLTERIKEWTDLLERAKKLGASVLNVRLDKENWDVREKEDLKTAATILKGLAWDVHTWQKLEIEKAASANNGNEKPESDEDEPQTAIWA